MRQHPVQPAEELRLHIVADALRRHAVLIVAVVVALTAAVAALAYTRAPSYESSAKIVLRPLTGNALSDSSATNGQQVVVAMETEAGLVTSPSVTERVNDQLGTDLAAGSDAVTASVPPNTQIVRIDFRGASPEQARAGADAFARSFLAYRADQATSTRGDQLDSLRQQAGQARQGLRKASAAASTQSAAQVQLYTNRLASLQENIGTLEAEPTDAGGIVTPADLPTAASGLDPALLTGLAALVALAVGIGAAIVRERTDDRVRTSDQYAAEVPLLGAVPVGGGGTLDPAADAVAVDAYRRVRTGLCALAARPSAIALVGASTAVGPATTAEVAAHLASGLVASGYRVVVVDATLGHGRAADVLGVPRAPGLADLLADDSPPAPVPSGAGVLVLPAGSAPGRAAEMLAGDRFVRLLGQLRDRADYVLVVAPTASTAEGAAVALASDGALLVLAEQVTTHEEVADLTAREGRLGTPVVGAVAVPRQPRRRGRRSPAPAPARPAGRAGAAAEYAAPGAERGGRA